MRPIVLPLTPSRSRPVRIEVLGECSSVIRAVLEDVPDRIELVGENSLAPPDVVLVRIPHPDDPRLGSLPAIASRRPGARLLVVGDVWSASALRTRRLDCEGLWIDEEMLATRLSLELAACSGELTAEALPATADRTEVFAAESSGLVIVPPCRVGIVSPDRVFREFCGDELTSRGATVVSWDGKPGAPVDTLVVDVDPLEDRHPCLQDPTPPCPLLILTSTPWSLRGVLIRPRHRVASKLAGGGEWARALSALLSPSS